MPERHPDHGVSRLVGFTDGVVAIAITLIVLPLVDSAKSLGSSSAADWVASNGYNLGAAALSFFVIASFWKEHHRLYQNVLSSTKALINANLIWLAGIIFLPLPTVLIVEAPGHDPVASGLYIGTILVTQIAIRLQEMFIVRADLMPDDLTPSERTVWADWIVVGLTLLALIISIAIPVTWLYPLLLLSLARPLRWWAQRGAPNASRRRYF